MTTQARSDRLNAVTESASERRLIGHEILKRVAQADFPRYPVNPLTTRGVLGACGERYLIPPGVDPLELGLIQVPGNYVLLPVDTDDTPMWDAVVNFQVTEAQAVRQRQLLMRSYQALHDMIGEADELDASVSEWSRCGRTHPVFGMLRLEIIRAWVESGHEAGPLSAAERIALDRSAAVRVAARIRAHVVR